MSGGTGATLAAVLEQDPRFSLERAARMARSLCLALDVAHRAGIVHRDLKPANLILCGAGAPGEVVKIVDFGIAKLAAAQTDDEVGARDQLIGTPAYMAPEQVRGDPATDGRADLYAVGVTRCTPAIRPERPPPWASRAARSASGSSSTAFRDREPDGDAARPRSTRTIRSR